jgi:hypothetical protein
MGNRPHTNRIHPSFFLLTMPFIPDLSSIRKFNKAHDNLTTYFAIEIVINIIHLYNDAVADGDFKEFNDYMLWIRNRQLFYDNIICGEETIIRVVLRMDEDDGPGIDENLVSALINTLNVDVMMALINEMLDEKTYKA